MELSELLSLLGDPSPEPFSVDWSSVEGWLCRPLPAAYKEIGSTFGPWYLGDWIWIQVPTADREWVPGYDVWLTNITRETKLRAREDHVGIPKLHPQEGGLLAWGHTRQTQVLFWDTAASKNPDEWPVVFYVNLGPLNDPWRHTGLTTVDFLATVVTEGIAFNEYRSLGPLPRTAEIMALRGGAHPWTPPQADTSSPEELAARRQALTEGSGLQALRALVPPSPRAHLDEETWQALFAALGTRLPSDYVDLMNTYGPGAWRGDLRFQPPNGLAKFAYETADAYRNLRGEFPEEFPLDVWPEPGGLLAFADSVDGDYIGWLTKGDPDEWPVVVWPRHYEQQPPLETGVVDTLLAVLRGQTVSGFARLDEDDDPLDFAEFESTD